MRWIVGQPDMNQQAEQHESDQQELVKQRIGGPGTVPFSLHDKETHDKETILPHSAVPELSVTLEYRTVMANSSWKGGRTPLTGSSTFGNR
jgi:hypothetical protein